MIDIKKTMKEYHFDIDWFVVKSQYFPPLIELSKFINHSLNLYRVQISIWHRSKWDDVDIKIIPEKPKGKNWTAKPFDQGPMSKEFQIMSLLSCYAGFLSLKALPKFRTWSKATWRCFLRWTSNAFRWIFYMKIFPTC